MCHNIQILCIVFEVNGRNLKELYLGDFDYGSDDSLNLAIVKFCTNLRKLSTGFKNDELETLKMVFNSCLYLESIRIWCGDYYLSEKDFLEIVAEYSPRNFHELELYYKYDLRSELLPEELKSFFINWTNRIPQKPLSLIIICNDAVSTIANNDENMQIIEDYIELGIIKKFEATANPYRDFY